MKVFKFGGASVKNAESIRNVAKIISKNQDGGLIVVVSAMGKTTNALEKVVNSIYTLGKEEAQQLLLNCIHWHESICKELFNDVPLAIQKHFFEALAYLEKTSDSNEAIYDAIVSYGEIWSTRIISKFCLNQGLNIHWSDAREWICTNDNHTAAKVNWEVSLQNMKRKAPEQLCITQGFIARSISGKTTTLGREGSDFSAAILAYGFEAESVTIWKDVPGLLNADPKYFSKTTLIPQISYREAVELAYFGASVIHPKTIKPLQNKNIPLNIRSFIEPEKKGTIVASDVSYDKDVSSFIFKLPQVLISISPRDFSFIDEAQLELIFRGLSQKGISVNLMQNSAISFSFCIDDKKDWKSLVDEWGSDFRVLYNQNLELVTVRHPKPETMKQLSVDSGYEIILEQRTRHTLRMVLKLVKPELLN